MNKDNEIERKDSGNKEILKLENINITYDKGKTYVLKDISFSVHSGEILSIIGVNGAGKSSLLKIIAGIQKQSLGKVIKKYKKLSYVPQKIDLDKSFPILVSEFISIYNPKAKKEDIISLLSEFEAEKLYDKKIGDLSGGELQKVLIVSALISSPDLILLDEPTAGIDIIGEEIFYKIIKNIQEKFKNISIILVSHNINLVYKNSDKVICLHENNFCCHGTPLEVSANKIAENIFGKYTLPYKHNPHNKNNHKN